MPLTSAACGAGKVVIPAPQHGAAGSCASVPARAALMADSTTSLRGAGDARGQRIQQEALGEADGLGRDILVTRRRPVVGGALDQRSGCRVAHRCPTSSLCQPYLVPPLIVRGLPLIAQLHARDADLGLLMDRQDRQVARQHLLHLEVVRLAPALPGRAHRAPCRTARRPPDWSSRVALLKLCPCLIASVW